MKIPPKTKLKLNFRAYFKTLKNSFILKVKTIQMCKFQFLALIDSEIKNVFIFLFIKYFFRGLKVG